MQIFENLTDINVEKPTAIAVGYFDGVHTGHRAVIEKAVSFKEMGLSPLVFSFKMVSSSPLKKKGALLLQSFTQKSSSIERMGADIFLCPPFSSFMGLSPYEFAVDLLYKKLNAKCVVCGYDYHFGKGAVGTKETLKELLTPRGVEVFAIDAVMDNGEPVSSTRIRRTLEEGNIQEANRLLGYSFTIDYPVVHGRHFGKTLGFPTINQIFPENKIFPRFGVYITDVDIDGKTYLGITNVGRKPTVGETDFVAAETYIDNFNGDLYGREISVSFLKFLRPEQKFATVDILKNAIAFDLKTAKDKV